MKIIHHSFILTFVCLLTSACLITACQEETIDPVPESFSYHDFKNRYGLNLLHSASIVTDESKKTVLRLTGAYPTKKGACWYGRSKMQVAKGFETTFSFRLSITDSIAIGGDGFAFVIQNAGQDSLGLGGGGLGYDGLANSLAIEFDTYRNSGEEFGDENGNHISIHSKGKEPNSVDERYRIGRTEELAVDLKDSASHEVRITYDGGTLTVFLDAQQVLGAAVKLQELLELSEGAAYIGFTAATGNAFQNHDILSWSFTPK